ncbi:MAG: 1-acyl-sn-glycerol-3-phosphate acyltransferase [Actinomycetia bacterium]|nr:1-acyl-sn-glycerol-3-phosphate acyltransferase [Actinomycetes bacterium]
MVYRIRWWLGGLLAHIYARFLFESVETVGSVDVSGPRLIVANHLSGLLDVIVVVRLLGGFPHILAKSTLFKPLPVGLTLRALGIIPLYRRSDHVDTTKNASSFRDVTRALSKGRTVLIFPEGRVTDNQELQTIRTGAARMALSAISEGVVNLEIIPVGITYENKIASRARVLAEVGDQIDEKDIASLADGDDLIETDHELVDKVTDLVTVRLGAVSPEFGSFVRERTMMLAASIVLRTSITKVFAEPKISELRVVAQQLAHATDPGYEGQLAATGRYQLALTACGVNDNQIQPRPSSTDLAKVVLRKGIVVLLLAPLALFGLVANLAAILLVIIAGTIPKKPMTKGTARAITGVIVFPVSWAIVIAATNPPLPWLTLGLIIMGLVVLIVGLNQLFDLIAAVSDWWSIHNSRALLPELTALRDNSVDELSLILGAPTT